MVIRYRTSSGGKFYGGTFDALKRTLAEEGYRAFTKGLGARVMWLAPGSAITIAASTASGAARRPRPLCPAKLRIM